MAGYCTVLLSGGLGNRLFQLASAYGFARRADLDLRLFRSTILPNKHTADPGRYQRFYREWLAPGAPADCTRLYARNPYASLRGVAAPAHGNVLLEGYFQNADNFALHREELVTRLGPSEDEISRLRVRYRDLDRAWFLHVRLGDARTHPTVRVDLRPYYQVCLERLSGEPVYLFCDRPDQLARIHPELTGFPLVEADEILSLYAMSLCRRGGICANSTYSWWGAYLNPNPERVVFMPARWGNLPYDCSPLFTPESVVVDVGGRWSRPLRWCLGWALLGGFAMAGWWRRRREASP